ncbi:hypothetical protein H257_14939 [Aphanomyces astaci]|uniref:Uncharacterized protein n=1 Tax=Aphanomyces astaci TaxID=112090 RepID=W4FP95_APHAT|nr:hypothetical protein H257_14939 [Aphanomyces astaci]ETV69317.1 hypothetical protein H257_14939 [Aphanomyces astaci]|eukprot:XP_009841174.1 hypothetical protein H257_14939 [Aphanomyces astaci]
MKRVEVYEWAIAAAFRRYHLTPLVARTEIIRCHLLALFGVDGRGRDGRG